MEVLVLSGNSSVADALGRFFYHVVGALPSISHRPSLSPARFSLVLIDVDCPLDGADVKGLRLAAGIKVLCFDTRSSCGRGRYSQGVGALLRKAVQSQICGWPADGAIWLEIRSIRSRLMNLFRSHGEDALCPPLDLALHLFVNGHSLLKAHAISLAEYEESFLLPGKAQWERFKNLLDENVDYLECCTTPPEWSRISSRIPDIASHLGNEVNEATMQEASSFLSSAIAGVRADIESLLNAVKYSSSVAGRVPLVTPASKENQNGSIDLEDHPMCTQTPCHLILTEHDELRSALDRFARYVVGEGRIRTVLLPLKLECKSRSLEGIGLDAFSGVRSTTIFIPNYWMKTFTTTYPGLDGCVVEYSRYRAWLRVLEKSYSKLDRILDSFAGRFAGVGHSISWGGADFGPSQQTHVHFLNLQLGSKSYWESVLEKAVGLTDLHKHVFVFYWFYPFSGTRGKGFPRLDVQAVREKFEKEHWMWGCSRFLRDYLHEQNVAEEVVFEGPIGLMSADRLERSTTIRWRLGRHTHHPDGPQPASTDYLPVRRVQETLQDLFGSADPAKNDAIEILSRPRSLAIFYLFNKNDNFAELLKASSSEECDLLHSVKMLLGTQLDLRSAHEAQSSKEDLFKQRKYKEVGEVESVLLLYSSLSSLARAVFYGGYEPVKHRVFFVDDKPGWLKEKLKVLRRWFPTEVEFKCDIQGNAWKMWFSQDSWKSAQADVVVIDLEYPDGRTGYELLHMFRRENRRNAARVVGVLSRDENPASILTAINSGASFYVAKANYLELIPTLHALFKQLGPSELAQDQYENWSLLNRLPPSKVLELKTSVATGVEYNYTEERSRGPFDLNCEGFSSEVENSHYYQWIRKLPKADLHCHVGSYMGQELIPQAALLVLSELYAAKQATLKANLRKIINFLLPVVLDPFLDECAKCSKVDEQTTLDQRKEFRERHRALNAYVQEFRGALPKEVSGSGMSVFQVLSQHLLKDMQITPEEALLSPQDTTIERVVGLSTESVYLRRKLYLRRRDISYETVMLVFLLLLHIRETDDWELHKLEKSVSKEITTNIFKKFYQGSAGNNQLAIQLDHFVKMWRDLLPERVGHTVGSLFADLSHLPPYERIVWPSGTSDYPLLSFLQSAHSEQRCVGNGNASLRNYLRGCEYGGSALLQTRASILLTARRIIDLARKDNIRYLCLRCAVDGYAKLGLQSQEEAMETLLTGLDFYSVERGRDKSRNDRIRVNVIVTAKKHKSSKEIEDNIRLALKYRYGLKTTSSDYRSRVELNGVLVGNSRVVSFDLAGLEKGNRPSRFQTQFLPLLRECFPVTIHVGEEDEHEAIWEAVYLLQSQRLGHALTLRNNPNLLDAVRERHVAIELCPISNLLTNSSFLPRDKVQEKYMEGLRTRCEELEKQAKEQNVSASEKEAWMRKRCNKYISERAESYPLRQYLDEYLDVTVNTDNPFVSNSTMTLEYLAAAQLSGGLTKWEILRLIKNSFRAAAIEKQEKRKLMDEIDEEIYDILLNEK